MSEDSKTAIWLMLAIAMGLHLWSYCNVCAADGVVRDMTVELIHLYDLYDITTTNSRQVIDTNEFVEQDCVIGGETLVTRSYITLIDGVKYIVDAAAPYVSTTFSDPEKRWTTNLTTTTNNIVAKWLRTV